MNLSEIREIRTFPPQIKLDFGSKTEDDDYKTTAGDELLVLPSQKRATKVKKTETVTRILSRKQRKRLEKIVDKKKKKENVRFTLRNPLSFLLNI